MNKYRAVIVATDTQNGVAFAKRSNSVLMTDHIIFEDISDNLSSLTNDEGSVTLSNFKDGFDEWVYEAKYFDESGKLIITIEYKICFDEKEDNDDD